MLPLGPRASWQSPRGVTRHVDLPEPICGGKRCAVRSLVGVAVEVGVTAANGWPALGPGTVPRQPGSSECGDGNADGHHRHGHDGERGGPGGAGGQAASPQLVEAATRSRAELARGWEDYERSLRTALRDIALETSFRVEIAMRDHPAADDVTTWLANAREAVRQSARIGIGIVLENDWITARFEPAAHSPGLASFEGASLWRDGWTRMRRLIRKKITQTAGAENVWLRIDDHDDLFRFGVWARAPLKERITAMATAIREAPHAEADEGGTLDHEHVAGVVMTSGLVTTLDVVDDDVGRADGAALLRRTVAPYLCRDTVVIALSTSNARGFERWYTAYDTEAAWLDEDLAARGFAPVADLFATKASRA
jgi:hypothetical protein